MKVHFSASVKGIGQHLARYRAIADLITSEGHQLARDWLKDYYKPSETPRSYTSEEWDDISSTTLKAILNADVVILEASTRSFSVGYQAAYALSLKKAVLVLFSSRSQQMIIDPNNSLKRMQVYRNDQELQHAVRSFLADNDIDSKNLRFNMVLDRETYSFLNWEAVHTGKSKGQIIREVLKDRINHKS